MAACTVLGVSWPAHARASDGPKLDAGDLLPPRHNPASVPATGSGTVSAVPMPAQTREAILLFDAGTSSERTYDLVNCLDGMTFGFGNWPQAKASAFFRGLLNETDVAEAFTARAIETFRSDPAAWRAFSAAADLTEIGPAPVRRGISSLLVRSERKNAPVHARPNGDCRERPPLGSSLFADHRPWIVPVLKRAFRDPKVVAYQVRYWESDVMDPARRTADRLGLTGPALFLAAFYHSNPGQIASSVRRVLGRGAPPVALTAAGRRWTWASPPAQLAGTDIRLWQSLLLWQAMCPVNQKGRFRIRSRNVAYFRAHLSADFVLPFERGRGDRFEPLDGRRENCDPGRVRLRHP